MDVCRASTLEPPIVDREIATLLERDETWYEQRLPIVEGRIPDRLSELSGRLGGADWLDGAFSGGDLLMVAVLRRLNGSDILHEYPNLSAYVARGEARPAFRRAFEAQFAVFTAIISLGRSTDFRASSSRLAVRLEDRNVRKG
jgi:glutathione S-transferase